MSARQNVIAWRVIGPVGPGPGWIGAEERHPPSMTEVYENGCSLELLVGPGAAVAELVEAARKVIDAAAMDPRITDTSATWIAAAKMREALAKLGDDGELDAIKKAADDAREEYRRVRVGMKLGAYNEQDFNAARSADIKANDRYYRAVKARGEK